MTRKKERRKGEREGKVHWYQMNERKTIQHILLKTKPRWGTAVNE